MVSGIKELALELKHSFDPYFPAPVQAWEDFASLCEEVKFKKGHCLKRAGEQERFFYFIRQGSAAVFLWKENNPVCLDFAFEGHFFSDYMSLVTGSPGPLHTELLEDSSLLRMPREKYLRLGEEGIGLYLLRIAAESSFISKQQQQIDLLTLTAEQRYTQLLETSPEYVRRLAQRHLASYLGITPQSLSRIRRHYR